MSKQHAGEQPDVVVSVTASGEVVCSPDPVVVTKKNDTLVFRLDTEGYVFRDQNPIVVTQPGTDFPYPSTTKKGTTALLYDRDKLTASYSYCVYLQEQATGRVISVDPTIENRPV